MRVTIKQIAERAGVSKATVSRVINNSKPVSDDIRKKVLQVIEETNFKPSSVARSLTSQSTQLIGVIIPDVSNPVFSKVINGIEEEAHLAGYNILLCNSRYKEDKELTYLDILSEKEVDGLILSGFHSSGALEKKLSTFSKPIVVVGYEDDSYPFPSVVINNYQACYDVASYLISLGHKTIGMIHGPLDDITAGKKRYDGFVQSVRDHGMIWTNAQGAQGSFKMNDGYDGAKRLMTQNPDMTAIFCANDEMAIGAMKAIHDAKKNIPKDIAVVGFDDIDLARIYQPSLTTIRQPFSDKGQAAMKSLIKLINGENVDQRTVFPYTLVERESTKK